MAATAAEFPAAGLVLGRYRPVRPLGTGGSGSVWLARDERTGIEVALKVVARDGKAGDRAEREAHVACRLRHPACARTFQLAHDDDHVYIAYEYIPGRTLRQAIKAGDLTVEQAVEAAAQVLDVLAHAHSRGVVHRDVKPANVILAAEPALKARLVDFGLAQLADAEPLTAAGDIPGTLAYIPPERLKGEQGGPRGDVWSVGVMLWEALAGWHPFRAPSLAATAKKIRAGAPPLETVRPDLPRPLLAAVDRALELDPARRPTAATLAEQLRQGRSRVRPAPRRPVRPLAVGRPAQRLAPAALAALFAGWTAAAFPFFPSGWPALLAGLAALATVASERGGLAFALAVPVFPLGNFSRGLALLYLAWAALWFCVHARRPRFGLAFAAGPLLAPVYLLGLLPVAVQPLRDAARRALQGATGVLAAALVCGVEGWALPFTGDGAPAVDVAGAGSPTTAARALAHALAARPEVVFAALALGLTAAALPLARRYGAAALGPLAAVAGLLLMASGPTLAAAPGVASIGALCAAAAVFDRRSR